MEAGTPSDARGTFSEQLSANGIGAEPFRAAFSEHDLRVHIADLLEDHERNVPPKGTVRRANVGKSTRRPPWRELSVSVTSGTQALLHETGIPCPPLSAPAFPVANLWSPSFETSRPLSRCASEDTSSVCTAPGASTLDSPSQDSIPHSAPSTSRTTDALAVSGAELFALECDESSGNVMSSISESSPLSRFPATPRSAPTGTWLGRIDSEAARLITLDQRYHSGTSLQPRRKRRCSNLPPGAQRGQFGKHVCPFSGCGRRFTLSGNLQVHIRTVHEREKPFGCPYPGCGRRFSQKGNANTHYRAVHLREIRFRCPVLDCGRPFAQKANLLFHAQRIHGLAELDLLIMSMHPFAADAVRTSSGAASTEAYTPKSDIDEGTPRAAFPNPAGG
jgi:hypothetical protein